MSDKIIISQQLKALRKKNGLSRDRLANLVGTSSNTILSIEKEGIKKGSKINIISTLADELDVSMEYLIYGKSIDRLTLKRRKGLNISENIIRYIEYKKLDIREFSKACSLSPKTIEAIVISNNLTFGTLIKIKEFTGLSIGQILYGDKHTQDQIKLAESKKTYTKKPYDKMAFRWI